MLLSRLFICCDSLLTFLIKLSLSCQIFKKYSSTKYHENPSSESRIVLCGRTGERTGDVTKLIVAFRLFANAPKTTVIRDVMTDDGCELLQITHKTTE